MLAQSGSTYAPFGTPVGASGTEKFEYAREMLNARAGPSPGLYYIFARWMDRELGSLSAPQPICQFSLNPGDWARRDSLI